MVLAGKHSIDIRTSGRVFARTAHQHSRFRATTSPSTSWQTLWQHSNSSLWHCHTDFHAGYQHKWHNAITVLCSKFHFNIGWTNITLNIAKNISIHITSHRLQLDIGRTVAAAVSCRLPTGTCCHWCHRRCHPPPSMSSYSMSSSIIKCNIIVLYQFQTQLSMSSYSVWSSSIHANIWVLYPISLRLDRRLGHETASIEISTLQEHFLEQWSNPINFFSCILLCEI